VILVLSPSKSPLFHIDAIVQGNANLFQPLLVLVEVVKTCGIPILMALAAIVSKHTGLLQGHSDSQMNENGFLRLSVVPAMRAIAAFMLLQLSTVLTTDFELVNKLLNPLVYQTGDTLETYSFRMVFMNGNYNAAGSLWLFQFLVQLLFMVMAYLLIRGSFSSDIFKKTNEVAYKSTDSKRSSFVSLAVTIIYSFIILLPLYLLFIYPFFAHSTSELNLGDLFSMSSFIGYMLINLAAVIIFLLITLTLAYPLTVRE
jgi:putative aldouronate transport system permease protein